VSSANSPIFQWASSLHSTMTANIRHHRETDTEQQSKLANPAAQAIVDTAQKASRAVLSFSYITEN
jgi:hypothetical protein